MELLFWEVVTVLVVVAVSVLEGAGVFTVLVVESLAGAELLLLHPENATGSEINKAAIANLKAISMDDIFIIYSGGVFLNK